MVSRTGRGIVALGLVLVAAGIGGYLLWGRADPSPVVGVVRATEVRVAPEVGGQLAAIKVKKGARVRAGDVVAELDALELTAAVAQARAELAAASASRDHVYAGVPDEGMATFASEMAREKSGPRGGQGPGRGRGWGATSPPPGSDRGARWGR